MVEKVTKVGAVLLAEVECAVCVVYVVLTSLGCGRRFVSVVVEPGEV